MSEELREFTYRPPCWDSWFFTIVSLAMVTMGLVAAIHPIQGGVNKQGFCPSAGYMRLVGVVTVVMGFLCGKTHGMPLVRRFRNPQSLIFTTDTLVVPKSVWSSKKVVVPYEEVREVTVCQIDKTSTRGLVIVHQDGKVTITDSWLPHTYDLEAICRLLRGRVSCPVPLSEDAPPDEPATHDV